MFFTYSIREDSPVVTVEDPGYQVLGAPFEDILLASSLIKDSVEAVAHVLDLLDARTQQLLLVARHRIRLRGVEDENSIVEGFDHFPDE